MNNLLLESEHNQFVESARRFVDAEIIPNATEWDIAESYPRELFDKFAELGWLGIGVPEAYGGCGGSSILYALLCAELARGSAAIALGFYVHTALANSALVHLGSEAQCKRWLPAAVDGSKVGCWAYAEPNAGADVSSVTTKATPDGDGYVLNGTKIYITNSPFADYMIVVAATRPEQGMKGLSVFVVDADTPGITVSKPLQKLGMGASEMAEIVFTDCRVSKENLLGPEQGGFTRALKVLTLGRIASAALGVGLGRAALQEAKHYCSERVQFGVPLVKNQFVRFTLADMATRLEAAWQLTLHTAALADAGQAHDQQASMAKLFATETCTWACERALHLCGAQGYMKVSAVQRFYRDCKVLEIGEGTSEIQRETIARHLGV
ncbi:MAG: acyl-CoA dehydrogenase [Halieaceae bacterium]|jgi:alkylation response protein AidB-like acyl-CoA dehydrogenase|nr:acyl-CoA dehydrogenase [Halieaceae bacterium]